MPQIVITQTAKEYADYSKKKARENLQRAIATIVFFALMMTILYYILWNLVHVA